MWLVVVFLGTTLRAGAQDLSQAGLSSTRKVEASISLPDAPGERSWDESSSSLQSSPSPDKSSSTPEQQTQPESIGEGLLSTRSERVVLPGASPPALSGHQKRVLALKESFSVFGATGWLASAGFAQLRNSSPNYGTDRGAFGQRLGATGVRSITDNFIGNGILAPILHEDPRYFEMGPGNSIGKRLLYATSRVFVIRSDSGHDTANISLLAGNLAGSALTNAYFPPLNRGVAQTAMTFGSGLGGSALGFVLSEFYDDALRIVHIEKRE